MKLHFLGTGAADWDPAAANNSVDFRRYSSLLVDDMLLIDPGPSIFEFADTFGCPELFDNVRDVICTHRHGDHFSEETLARLTERGAVFHELSAGDTVSFGGYLIRAYAANHATAVDPMHFVIESEKDGKRFFYGCDGAWMFYDTYRSVMELGKLELMIFDCTIGDIHGDYRIFEHNNVAMVSEMSALFKRICPRFMVSHLARTLHPSTHAETATVLSKYGLETAHDNLIIEI